MTDLIAPIVTFAVMALFVAAWVFYLRRVRQGRADPVVDPSWPSNLRPMPRQLILGRRRRQAQYRTVQPDLDFHRGSHWHGVHALDSGDEFLLRRNSGDPSRFADGCSLTAQTRRLTSPKAKTSGRNFWPCRLEGPRAQ